jgi:hypothetical protein
MWSVLVLVFRDVVYSVPGIGLRDVVCPFTGLQMCGLHMSCYWSAEMWYIPRNGLQKGSSYWLWYTEVQCPDTVLQREVCQGTAAEVLSAMILVYGMVCSSTGLQRCGLSCYWPADV